MRPLAAVIFALALLVVAAAPAMPQEQITTHPSFDCCPTWSPDGSLIAFHSGRSAGFQNPDIWVIPATGGTATQITTHPSSDSHPAWSPDGSLIAYMRGFTIWVIPATGGTATQITTHSRLDSDPPGHPTAVRSPSSHSAAAIGTSG